MTIDEAIAHAREVAKENRYQAITYDDDFLKRFLTSKEKCKQCAEEHEQLAEWLEQLKIFKECNISKINFENGYNKAIDDFLKEICKKYTEEERKQNFKQYCHSIKQELADIAEQLKAGDEV